MENISFRFNSIITLISTFSTEQKCIDYLTDLRWKGNVVSPFDETSRVYVCQGNRYKCKNTGKYFNVRTGTMFDNTKIPLQKWFLAIWLSTSHKKGISSIQLSKDLDITQKSAWFMLQRIRNCFGFDSEVLLSNDVEVDEAYIGGDVKNMSNSKRKKFHENGAQTGMKHMAPVLGMVERGGKVRAVVLDKANGETIKPVLDECISPEAHVITDGFGGYYGINKKFSQHSVINHSAGEYVKGDIHTNTIEGFWSLLKRSIFGIYHFTSKKHLQKYVNENAFRYNTRECTEQERFNVFLGNMERRLTYKRLIHA